MPATWAKSLVTRNSPFDGTSETVLEVNAVQVNGVSVTEIYTFADGTTDAMIQMVVEADLTAKGYVI